MCWLSGIFGPSVEMSLQESTEQKNRDRLWGGHRKNALLNLLIGEFSGLVGPSVSSVSRCMLRGIWSIAKDSMIFLTRSGGFMLMIFCNVYHASRLQKHD